MSDANYIGIKVVAMEDRDRVIDLVPFSRPRTAHESEKVLRGMMINGDTDNYLFVEVESDYELAESGEDRYVVRGITSGVDLTHPVEHTVAESMLKGMRVAEIADMEGQRGELRS